MGFKIATLILICSCNILFSQNIDSLKLALNETSNDSLKVILCLEFGELIYMGNDDDAKKIWEEGQLICEKKLTTQNNKSKFYLSNLAELLNNLGFIAQQHGNIKSAIEYYHKSLKIDEKLKNNLGVAYSLSNIGLIYNYQNDFATALEYYKNSLTVYEKIRKDNSLNEDNNIGYATCLNNIGYLFDNQGQINQAESYFNKSLIIRKEINDDRGIAESLNNLGTLYLKRKLIDKAISFFENSLVIQSKIDDKTGVANTNANIAKAYFEKNKINKALKYASKSYNLSVILGFPDNIYQAADILKLIYLKLNKHKEAFEMFEISVQMKDSINNTLIRKVAIKKQFQFQYEKKAAADSVKNAEEQKVKNAQLTAQQAQLKQEKTQRFVLYSGLILVIAFSGFVFNRFKITQKQKGIIEKQKHEVDAAYEKLHEKNKEVMDSIRYAARIQRCLITSEKYITQQFKRLSGIKKSVS